MNVFGREMNSLSDNQLISQIKSGDTNALEILIKRYMNQVKIMARKSFLVGGEEEDLYQEGLMAIINATHQYDDTKNISFSTFVTTCIKRKIIDTIRTATRYKHKPLNEAFPLSAKEIASIDMSRQGDNPLDNYLEREWMDNFYKKLETLLNPQQLIVLSLYFEGYSYAEIAQHLYLPIKKIDNMLFNIKNKIGKEFRATYLV